MLRRFLNIASIVCLVLCVALMGMCVRSYYDWDALHGRFADTRGFQIASLRGQLSFLILSLPQSTRASNWPRSVSINLSPNFSKPLLPPEDDDIGNPSNWRWKLLSAPSNHIEQAPRHGFLSPLGFSAIFSSIPFLFVVPLWFLVLTSGSLAMLFKMRWPPHFTLRGLFILTTFLAVLLGMIALLDGAWIGK